MSTAAQLEFVAALRVPPWDDRVAETEVRRVFRRSDGRPDSVFFDLAAFHDWIVDEKTGDRTLDGPGYTAANFIYFMKRRARRDTVAGAKRGYGVCDPDTVHHDTEYFYRVELRPQRWVVKCWSVDQDASSEQIEALIAGAEPDDTIEFEHPPNEADIRQLVFTDRIPAGDDA